MTPPPLDPDPLTVPPDDDLEADYSSLDHDDALDDDLPTRTGCTISLVLAIIVVVVVVLVVSRLAG